MKKYLSSKDIYKMECRIFTLEKPIRTCLVIPNKKTKLKGKKLIKSDQKVKVKIKFKKIEKMFILLNDKFVPFKKNRQKSFNHKYYKDIK